MKYFFCLFYLQSYDDKITNCCPLDSKIPFVSQFEYFTNLIDSLEKNITQFYLIKQKTDNNHLQLIICNLRNIDALILMYT